MITQEYAPPAIRCTFNVNSIMTPSSNPRVDDNLMQTSATQPWVCPYEVTFRVLTFSGGTIVGTPTYDLNIFKNAVLQFTIALTAADIQSDFDIELKCVPTDELSSTIVQTSAVGSTIEDCVIELVA